MAEKKKHTSAAPATDKKGALDTALAKIEKDHGKGAIMRMGDRQAVHVDVISTGSISIDFALGVGGVPKGRIIEIFGPESSGKTTLALHIIAQAQKAGGEAAFIDAEHALEPAYARALGVDIDNLLISQPDMGDDALAICEVLVRSGAVDVIVVDSVAALVPRAEIENNIGDPTVGVVARLMSQALRKLASSISKTNCIVIFINQLRSNIGGPSNASKETTPGGRALRYFTSVRIDVRRIGSVQTGSEHIGNRTKARVVKNKVAPPFREVEFDIVYGEGISRYGELIDLGLRLELIEKAGSWFSFNELRFQGRDNLKEYLKDNPEVADDLEATIRRDSHKLMSTHEKRAAKAAGRGIDIDADDFEG